MEKVIQNALEKARVDLHSRKMLKACLLPFFVGMLLAVPCVPFGWSISEGIASSVVSFMFGSFLPQIALVALGWLVRVGCALGVAFCVFSAVNGLLCEYVTLPAAIEIAKQSYPRLASVDNPGDWGKSIAHSLACLILYCVMLPFVAIFLIIPVLGFLPLYVLNAWFAQKTLRREALGHVCSDRVRQKIEKASSKTFFKLALWSSAAYLVPVFNILANGYVSLALAHLCFVLANDAAEANGSMNLRDGRTSENDSAPGSVGAGNADKR